MKKVWLPRDSIYPKPFYKQKLKVCFLLCLVVATIYFGYQIFYLNKLEGKSIETTQILVQDNYDPGPPSRPTPDKQYVEVVR